MRDGIKVITIKLMITLLVLSLVVAGLACYVHSKQDNYIIKENGVTVEYIEGDDRVTVENKCSEGECIIVNVMYEGEQSKYNCYVYNDGYNHDILLSNGAGMYTLSIWLEDKDGNVESIKNVCIKSESDTQFTGATYNVECDKYSYAIEELINEQGWTEETEQEVIFEYFHSYEYDDRIADGIRSGSIKRFMPNIADVISTNRGICYDIASTITAVERELGHEARMVVGVVGESSAHSWCEVYINGEWVNMDTLLRDSYYDSAGNNIEIIHYY